MRRAIGLSLCLFLAAPTARAAEPKTLLARYQALTARRSCPDFGKIDVTKLGPEVWRETPGDPAFHRDLRAQTDTPPVPETGTRVLLGWSGGHHETISGSLALTRDAAGTWRAEGVDTFLSKIPVPPGQPERTTEITHKAWTLTAEDGARLDALIADPCLEAEPRNIILYGGVELIGGGRDSCIGGVVTTLEVFDRKRRLTRRQHCGRWGVTGQISELAFDSRKRATP